jgi:hypothetical protein
VADHLSDIEELRDPVGPQYDRLLGMGSESREIHPYHEAIRAIEAARNYDKFEEEFDFDLDSEFESDLDSEFDSHEDE